MGVDSDGGMIYTDRGKPKNLEKNLHQCYSVHHKSNMD
jgi:hypothetical protein